MTVDCAIPVFGRPWQTALALLSLLRYSRQHVGRVWFEDRPGDPLGLDARWVPRVIMAAFPDVEVIYWRARHNLAQVDYPRAAVESWYRLDFPFQRAWENCGDRALVLLHNDMRFVRDEIPDMLAFLGGSTVGVGRIGICHACPAHKRGCAGGAAYESFRPTHDQVVELLATFDSPRMTVESLDPEAPWPLTECRLNEMFAIVSPAAVRHLVFPRGSIPIIGERCFPSDGGVRWFGGLCRSGFRFAHYRYHAVHRAGYPTCFNLDEYRSREAGARDLVRSMPEIEGVSLPD